MHAERADSAESAVSASLGVRVANRATRTGAPGATGEFMGTPPLSRAGVVGPWLC